MCSEPCGIGEQKYTRKQSPWGSKRASDCDQKESKMKECILSGCTGIKTIKITIQKYQAKINLVVMTVLSAF